MIAFEHASYLAQVRRLRKLAMSVLKQYPIQVESCRFINHGENTTFQITASSGKRFLLRIHRPGYHTKSAILEELSWLESLDSASGLLVPRLVKSKRGRRVETMGSVGVPHERHCCLFEWIDGRFIHTLLKLSHLNILGRTIGRLQAGAKGRKVHQRMYWDADGLVGENAKFGPIDDLPEVSDTEQRILSDGRRLILRRLRNFQTTYPHKQGLIHADVHFGNILVSGGGIAVIDFDDCGFGFHAYDLAVPLTAIEHLLRKRKREFPRFRDALIEGYAAESGWDPEDQEILPHLVTARRIAMLGWLHSRRDNPSLRRFFKKAVTRAIKRLTTRDE